ncbi:STAS/SEC14 domain-containing protein [Leucothrix arctica]|uniref:STAS/SEC14 domain-containing protein n=1 Tax=Leucothrix arctica TaxID=1481894 RepID=A0A317CMM8_9GAMM|nr:STAS/SEC14 domain-containing protein [Leucothrix arctica]PWQ97570.1 hypothetical protein DKT75_06530 [Leucothrix arctica]
MFNVTSKGENRVDIEISGKLDAESMKFALDDLIAKSESVKHGKMRYTIIDLHLPSLGAIGVEFTRLPALFGLLGKFDRAAVLTDRSWLQKASEIKGAVIPGIDIKAFDLDQVAEAEAWLDS